MKINHVMVSTAVVLAASVVAFSAPASAAVAVTIGLQEAGVNGGAITNEGSAVSNFSYGTFNVNSITGTALPLPSILDTSALDATASGAGTLNVFVTETGITAPIGTPFFNSGFTLNNLTAGWTVQEQTFLSSGNGLFTGTALGSQMFSAIGAVAQSDSGATGAGPYSITAEYTIIANSIGNSNATIDISAVPEPATWGMMLIGFGAVGFMMRGSRRKQTAALA
jgi:hypothetical protein